VVILKRDKVLDNSRDFRGRYKVPEHFTRDPFGLSGIWYFRRMRDVLKLFDRSKKKVLDLGCGDGFFSRMLLDDGYTVTGIDYSKRAIQFAQAINREGRFIEGDIRTLKLKERFDQVSFIAVLEHIHPKYQEEILRKVHSLLNRDGNLIILLPSKFVKPHEYHYKHYTKEEIVSLLKKSGFKIEKILYHNRCDFPASLVYNLTVFRFLKNSLYDLTVIRRMLKNIYERRFSSAKQDNRYMLITVLAKKP
jgi:2-polyprenyl-3-methyl-5-hydroxy-6-metoxy-1,4-benzoquinol methylase